MSNTVVENLNPLSKVAELESTPSTPLPAAKKLPGKGGSLEDIRLQPIKYSPAQQSTPQGLNIKQPLPTSTKPLDKFPRVTSLDLRKTGEVPTEIQQALLSGNLPYSMRDAVGVHNIIEHLIQQSYIEVSVDGSISKDRVNALQTFQDIYKEIIRQPKIIVNDTPEDQEEVYDQIAKLASKKISNKIANSKK